MHQAECRKSMEFGDWAGFEYYANLLCDEDDLPGGMQDTTPDVWFEAQPLSPRAGEGNTVLDLALGCLGQRGETASGIESLNDGPGWTCFVEAKMFSDCSVDTTHDPLRNQLARVIENLLCFQAGGQFPDSLYFTLITPRIFQDTPHSRLYGYKFEAYNSDEHATLLDDINLCPLPHRQARDWQYPVLEQRLPHLHLNWITYEEIFEHRFGIEQLDLTTVHSRNPDDIQPLIQRLNTIAEGPGDLE